MAVSEVYTHDIIVIGTSLGGVEALTRLLAQIPEGFPGAIHIVQHIDASRRTYLPELLAARSRIPVVLAEDGQPIEPGKAKIAPPDHHMLLTPNGIRLSHGPRENHTRPAIDPLFRSAAAYYRSRVIGVVLTGMLDDGAAGLRDIKQCGGVTVVQDPSEAAHPDMPQNALEATQVDHCVSVDGMGKLLEELVRQPASPAPPPPPEVLIEARIAEGTTTDVTPEVLRATCTRFACPACGGVLMETPNGEISKFRCRTGHSYTSKNLVSAQTEQIEHSLWAAVRSLQEQCELLDHLMERARSKGREREAAHYQTSADELRERERTIRAIVLAEEPYSAPQ